MNTFNYNQEVASAEWLINHKMNALPATDVTVLHAGKMVKMNPLAVEYVDGQNIRIRFSQPYTGSVRLVSTWYVKPGDALEPIESGSGGGTVTPPAPTDPLYQQVSFLMQMDGGLTEEKGATLTPVGTPQTVPGLYGDAVRIGNTGYFSSTTRPLSTLGTQDFTFEFYTRINSLGGVGDHDYICFELPPIAIGMDGGARLYFEKYGNGWGTMASISSLKTDGTWQHVAITRAAGTTRMFFDGAVVATTNNLNGVDLSQTHDTFVGARGAGTVRTGTGNYDIDDFRITVGTARYTEAFTPPTAEFPAA